MDFNSATAALLLHMWDLNKAWKQHQASFYDLWCYASLNVLGGISGVYFMVLYLTLYRQ